VFDNKINIKGELMSASSEVQQLLAHRFSPTDFILNETGIKPSSLDPVEKIYDGLLALYSDCPGDWQAFKNQRPHDCI